MLRNRCIDTGVESVGNESQHNAFGDMGENQMKDQEMHEDLERGLKNRHIQLIGLGGAIGVGLFLGSATAIELAGPSVLLTYVRDGANVSVCGIEGNFDDAQSTVKKIFSAGLTEEEGGDAVVFSSANSINIGRLFPQVVYYVWMWLSLVRSGSVGQKEAFNVVVPTGNFGNILAAWVAKRIGTPIGQLVCASNDNHILSDFFATGTYDKRREFHLTKSPSMDILISSNFERFLYYMEGDRTKVADAMKKLREEGVYSVGEDVMEKVSAEMMGGWADGAAMESAISDVYEKYDYLMDPHTAVAYAVYNDMRRKGKITRGTHTVIVSTAHPYKFPDAIAGALHIDVSGSAYDKLRTISDATGIAIPAQLSSLEDAPVRFGGVIGRDDMDAFVKDYAKSIGGKAAQK